jgi:hypothetical protein
MKRLAVIIVILIKISLLSAQLISIPLDFSFNQADRFDDDVLVTVLNKDSFTVLRMDSRKNEMPYFNKTYYLIDTGKYDIRIVFKNDGETDSLIRNYTFSLTGKEEIVRLALKCSFDTLDKKSLTIFRNNNVKIVRNIRGNPANLELKRLWKNPIRRDSALHLPYEIYNPSDKLLYTNEDNGVEFMLEQFAYGRWQYLNCGAVLRLGKPFKPQQRYSIVKGTV